MSDSEESQIETSESEHSSYENQEQIKGKKVISHFYTFYLRMNRLIVVGFLFRDFKLNFV